MKKTNKNGILRGRVALITGASGGMGSACALNFANHGANLILTSRSRTALSAVAQRIRKIFPDCRILAIPTDVQNNRQVRMVVQRGIHEFGQIDYLLNFAGYNKNYPRLSETRPQADHIRTVEKIVDIDLLGTIRLILHVEPLMRKRKEGMILTMGNTSLLDKRAEDLFFQIGKVGNRQISEALASQHRKDGMHDIRVYFLAPGLVYNRSTYAGMSRRQWKKAKRQGWLSSLQHIAPLVLWLATGRLKRSSGATIRFDPRTAPAIFREVGERYVKFVPPQ